MTERVRFFLHTKRLAAEKGNERLREAFENHEVLKATVTQILGGGICTTVDEVRVFIPASLVSDSYEKDLSKYEGQEIEFVISEFNPRRNRVIGDRRQLLVAERAEKQKELFAKLHVGDTVEGTVKNVTDFGHSLILVVLTVFFISQRCHGDVLIIQRKYSMLVMS